MSRQYERRAYTPNNSNRPTQFQHPGQSGPTIQANAPAHKIEISISRNRPSGISITPTGSGTPVIQRRQMNFNPVQNQPGPAPPQIQRQATGPIQVHTNSPVNGPIIINRPPGPVITRAQSGTVAMPPSHSPTIVTSSPHISTISRPHPVKPQQQADQFCRLSLLSFVSAFEDGRSFNETDLASLGLDLKCKEPLLPMMHSVLSDAPMLDKSVLPAPNCYAKIDSSGKAEEKIQVFSEETLLYIFYSFGGDPMQTLAAEELVKRGYTFDKDSCVWKSASGMVWNVDQWKGVEDSVEENVRDD